VFLEKLNAQDWLNLFTNTKRGCSVLDLAEFYANCIITNGVVTSTVNSHKLHFDARHLGEMLGVTSDDFDVYVCEDNSLLGDERLLELTCKLAQKPHLTESRSVRKGEMMPLHRCYFGLSLRTSFPEVRAAMLPIQ